MKPNPTAMEDEGLTDQQIAKHFAEFFKDEPEKITMWWLTKNPLIGGIEPCRLWCIQPNKFKRWIKNLIDGDIA